MAALIYSLCAFTSLACFVMLWRSWRHTRSKLVFWSALCFAALSLNNIVLVADKVVLPNADLSMVRLWSALAAVLLLLYGLIWGDE